MHSNLSTKDAISLSQLIFLTLLHTVNIFKLITETIPTWHMRNKQCVIFQFIKWNSNSYRWQQNIQLSEIQELPVPQQLNHKWVTRGPAEIKIDCTPFSWPNRYWRHFFKPNLHRQISICTSHQKQNTKRNKTTVKKLKSKHLIYLLLICKAHWDCKQVQNITSSLGFSGSFVTDLSC